jgi:hypothetical protein
MSISSSATSSSTPASGSVALATAWISSVDPRRQVVVMNIDRKRIEEGPDYSEEHVLDRDYETRLHAHYQYPPYWV